ncbi:MAG: nickel pincer cofactor biosynthesis protein LarC [Thermofilaceae archaeon]
MRALLIDASVSGVSGDMLTAALLDMGADVNRLHELASALPSVLDGVRGFKVSLERVERAGVRAVRLDLRIDETEAERGFPDFYVALERLRSTLNLSDYVYGTARAALKLMEEAEAAVHGGGGVHLHELASADTLFDVVAAPLLIESLGLAGCRVMATPVAVGGGPVRTAHGLVSSPAPATREILRLRGIPFRLGPVEGELATPTGVAVLAALADEFLAETPALEVARVGYGAGSRDYGVQPLIAYEVKLTGGELRDRVAVLETNVDDVDGELLAYARDLLMERGALDVYTIPAVGKKGRPAFIVQVLAEPSRARELAQLMMKELGTLGVRWTVADRLKLRRETVEVEVSGERVRAKIAYDGEGRIVRVKPEAADLERYSRRKGVSLREAREQFLKAFGESSSRQG